MCKMMCVCSFLNNTIDFLLLTFIFSCERFILLLLLLLYSLFVQDV